MRGSPESWTTAVGAYVVVGCWWGDRCRVVELLADGSVRVGWRLLATAPHLAGAWSWMGSRGRAGWVLG